MEIDLDDIFKQLPNKPLLSLFEVASFLGLSKRTIYNLYPDELKGTNIRGSIRIYRCSVIELVKKNDGKKGMDEEVEPVKQEKKTASKRSGWVKGWSGK